MKRISRLNPPPSVGRERAERHYTTVHHPFARRLLRDHGPRVRRYSVDRADWQYSLSGRFEEQPTAWRFVVLEVDDDLPDALGYLPPWVQPLLWTDHAKCIERMAAWEVEARTVVDRRSGQLSSAKFVFLYESAAKDGGDRLAHYRDVHVPALADLVRDAFGARLYVSNTVIREAETSDEHGPAASYTGAYLERSTLLAIDEIWFDNIEWGADAFGSAPGLALLRDSELGRVEGYAVEETVGVDKSNSTDR